MIGTIANTCTILIGSCIGAMLRRGIRPQYRDCLYNAMGLAAIGLGANTVVGSMSQSESGSVYFGFGFRQFYGDGS